MDRKVNLFYSAVITRFILSFLSLLHFPFFYYFLMAEATPGNSPVHRNKNVEHDDDQSSFTSDATQTGVKNIEAVSQTWSQSSLIAAYLG